MSYSYERSSKTLNEAYCSDSDSDQLADSSRFSGSCSRTANLSRSSYSGAPSFARVRADLVVVRQHLPPMKDEPSVPDRQFNHNRQSYYYSSNNYSKGGLHLEDFRNKPTSLFGRTDDDIFADLERVVNRGYDRSSRDDTPSLMSDDTSRTSSTPSVASPPVSPLRDPSPPHVDYPSDYYGHNYGHKSHDSAENALVSSTEHMRIEPSKGVAEARAPSHHPIQLETSVAQTKLSSPYTIRAEYHSPIVATARNIAPPCPYAIQTEPPCAIPMADSSRSLAPIPPPSPSNEFQARMIESPRSAAPRSTPQLETQIERPKAVANPFARLRTLAPRTIEASAQRVDKAEILNKVDTTRLDLLADSALGNEADDNENNAFNNQVIYLPAVKRQRAQKLEKPHKPPPQKKRGRYECKLCPHVFTRNFDLTRHVRTIHETRPEDDILSRTCPSCGEVQSRGDSHRRHMAIVPASCERQAKILGKPAPAERSQSFYAMCRSRAQARPLTPPPTT